MEQVVLELGEAARIMNAPPISVSQDQRKQAESLLLKFKKSDKPYAMCKTILESTDDPYLHFLASSTIKEGVMREWSMFGDLELDQLRDYLLNYAHTHHGGHAFVLRQILHVVALIVKRSILSRDTAYLDSFVTNVCSLFTSLNTLILGLEIAGALLAEFTVADKTLSSYMSYQHNLDCKIAIEDQQLYKVFIATVEVTAQLKPSPVANHKKEWTLIMSILHAILSWDFGIVLSKRLAQMSSLSLPVTNLMPGQRWGILKEDKVMVLLVDLYAMMGCAVEIQHTARLCIVQLGTLQGPVFREDKERVTFLSKYMAAILKLVRASCTKQSTEEDHGLAMAVRQLLWANTCQDMEHVHVGLFKEFLGVIAEHSVKVILSSAKEDEMEGSSQEVVDVVLDIWFTLLQMENIPRDVLSQCVTRVVECYVKCHLAPPQGIRDDSGDMDEVDVDTEEDDRVKYRDQLEIVGSLARVNLAKTLPQYTGLLLERVRVIAEKVENQEECYALYEDVHWLVLLIGYTLADPATDSDQTIPSSVLEFFSNNNNTAVNVEELQMFLQARLGSCGAAPTHNVVISAVMALLQLAALYQDLLGKGGSLFLSAQVYSSLMWSLTRVMASYHMPYEQDYQFIPRSLLQVFGADSPIGEWLVGFLVEKIISGLVFYSGEVLTTEDCLALTQTLAKNPRITRCLLHDGNFQKLIERYTSGTLVLPSSKCNRMFSSALTLLMSHLPKQKHKEFMNRVFSPVQESIVSMLFSPKITDIPNSPVLTQQVLTTLDTFHGMAAGIVNKIVDIVFETVLPVLEGSVKLLAVCQHSQPITRSILELFCAVSDSGILQIDKRQTLKLYETCYSLLKCYSDHSTSKEALVVGKEDDRHDNILLCLELLSHLCSKDFFNFDEPDENHDETSSKLVFVGLDIIVPHIDVDLLKFPKLSNEFFKLITFMCEVYPEKVVNLPEGVVDQIILMLKVGLNNYNDDITFYIFNAVSALSIHSVNNPDFQKKIGQIIKHTLLLISGQELSAELYDTAADMVFSFICKCRKEYMAVVNEIVSQQEEAASRECLRAAFSALIPSSTALTRRDKGKFSKIFENFAVNVYGICR